MIPYAYAQDSEVATTATEEHTPITPVDAAVGFMYDAAILLGIILIISLIKKSWTTPWKVSLFVMTCLIVLFTTIGLIGTTVTVNITSPTKGPVHWHVDFKVAACGQEVELIDPTGFSNKVGAPLLHEHNDNRIHVEGVPTSLESIDLASFFAVIGGSLQSDSFTFPSTAGITTYRDGDLCNGVPGTVRLFVERQQDLTRVWEEMSKDQIPSYLMSPEEHIPPGDRFYLSFDAAPAADIIAQLTQIEFIPPPEKTN